jgi:hypothetical protein
MQVGRIQIDVREPGVVQRTGPERADDLIQLLMR